MYKRINHMICCRWIKGWREYLSPVRADERQLVLGVLWLVNNSERNYPTVRIHRHVPSPINRDGLNVYCRVSNGRAFALRISAEEIKLLAKRSEGSIAILVGRVSLEVIRRAKERDTEIRRRPSLAAEPEY